MRSRFRIRVRLNFHDRASTASLVYRICLELGARPRIDLHGGGHASHQPDAIRHLINLDAYRHALASRTQVKIGFTEARPA